MIVYWDSKKRDKLIEHCINSIKAAKNIEIEIKDIDTVTDPKKVYLWTRVWSKAVYTQGFSIYFDDIAKALNIKGNELDLNNLSDRKLIKLGEFIIKTIWYDLFVHKN